MVPGNVALESMRQLSMIMESLRLEKELSGLVRTGFHMFIQRQMLLDYVAGSFTCTCLSHYSDPEWRGRSI